MLFPPSTFRLIVFKSNFTHWSFPILGPNSIFKSCSKWALTNCYSFLTPIVISVTDISQYHTANNNNYLGRPWLLAAHFPSWYDASHIPQSQQHKTGICDSSYSEISLFSSLLDSCVNSTIFHATAPGSSESQLTLTHPHTCRLISVPCSSLHPLSVGNFHLPPRMLDGHLRKGNSSARETPMWVRSCWRRGERHPRQENGLGSSCTW